MRIVSLMIQHSSLTLVAGKDRLSGRSCKNVQTYLRKDLYCKIYLR